MNVTIDQKRLAAALGDLKAIIPTKAVSPYLANVLLEAGDGGLRLTATDLTVGLAHVISCGVLDGGSVALPGRLLADLVAALPEAPVDIDTQRPGKAVITCGRATSTLTTWQADDFPPLPAADGEVLRVAAPALRSALSSVLHCAADTSDGRLALQSVYLSASDDTLTCVCADGFRLAVATVPLAENSALDRPILLPTVAARALLHSLGDAAGTVTLALSANTQTAVIAADLDGGSAALTAQLRSEQFPNYQQFIPKTRSTHVTIAAPALLKLVRLVGVMAGDAKVPLLRISVLPGESTETGTLLLTGRGEEVGEQEIEADAQIEGGATKIAFSVRYLLETLAAFGDAIVTLNLGGPDEVASFTTADGRLLEVLVPMTVQW